MLMEMHMCIEFVALACILYLSGCPLANVRNPYRTAEKVYYT